MFIMVRRLLAFLILFITGICFAAEMTLKDYDEVTIPAGYHIPIMSLQEFSTAYTEEGELLNFVTTNDIFLFDKNLIPKGVQMLL